MGSFKSSNPMYSVYRWGNKSPGCWGCHRTRFVAVCTRLSLCARPDKLWLPPLTTPQPKASSHLEEEPAMLRHSPDSALRGSDFPRSKIQAAWLEMHGILTSERQEMVETLPVGELLVFCFSYELVQGREFLKYSFSGAIPCGQMPTSVLSWSDSWLSNTSPFTALPPFLPQVIPPRHSCFPRIACSSIPLPQQGVSI